MYCFHCKEKIDLQKIHFKSTCEKCFSYLHVCKNCKNYFPGKPNDCTLFDVENIPDKEKFNFCEEFKPLDQINSDSSDSISSISKKLFDEGEDNNPSSFDSLFKD